MTQQQIKNSFFIGLTFLIFLTDLALFMLNQSHFILLLHCFTIALLSCQHQNRIIFACLFLLSILSYLDDNMFGSCLIYMLPILWLAYYLQEHLHVKTIIPYILLIASVILKLLITYFVHSINFSFTDFVTLVVYNCLPLTIILILQTKIKTNL